MADRVIRLRPYNYIHVLNNNTNVTTVELGPKTFVRRDHEQVVAGPSNMINIPPRSYCVIANPAFRNEDNSVVLLENGQVKLKHGETEIRLYNDWPSPFPLYPGEILVVGVTLLTVVAPNSALRIQAVRNFEDVDGQGQVINRAAGDEWLFVGPATYIPRVEAKVVETVFAQIIRPNEALRLRAKRAFTDRNGVARSAGEEWLLREPGSVLCDVEEEVVGLVKARVLTERKALHLLAEHTFTDVYGVLRKAGQEWLVTHKLNQLHIPDIYENVRGEVDIRVLGQNQYAVVLNPVGEDGNPRWGTRELRLGEQSFFLQPGEKLAAGIQNIEILSESEALLLRANEKFVETVDGKREERYPGQEWMIYGPRRYVPPVEVEIVESRKRIPLDLNEGIYVRDKKTGKVYTVTGQTYMLKPNEELWNKELPAVVEQLLVNQVYSGADSVKEKPKPRIAHKVVTYRVPHNAAVQLYDYKKKKSRVVFGPELVMLEPDEEFTIVSLSGGEPKRPNAITSLSLSLGPDFMSDSVIVETSDHARLRLKLSYNWAFEVEREDEEQAHVIFSVRDFVGDTCKAIASRVRGAVAAETFDNFHKNSADIIRRAVFGVDEDGVSGEKLLFSANLLAITNVDIQSVEPVEQRTRDALQKSVQLAIEIATASQEALSNHEAAREEQIAEGKLQRQKIADQSSAERDRKVLVELKAQTASARAKGQAKAEAEAEAEAALIQARTAVSQAEKKAQALKIRSQARLAQLKSKQQQELAHKKACDELEIKKAEEQAQIEAEKFAKIVNAIGADTIQAIAQAGPEMQAKLLEGLGLQGFLVTDGTSPINLFNTANGLVGN